VRATRSPSQVAAASRVKAALIRVHLAIDADHGWYQNGRHVTSMSETVTAGSLALRTWTRDVNCAGPSPWAGCTLSHHAPTLAT
jgi:hypothetical protein